MRYIRLKPTEHRKLLKSGYLVLWGANETCWKTTKTKVVEKLGEGFLNSQLDLLDSDPQYLRYLEYDGDLPPVYKSLVLSITPGTLRRCFARDKYLLVTNPLEVMKVTFDAGFSDSVSHLDNPDIFCKYSLFSVAYCSQYNLLLSLGKILTGV